MAASKPTSSVFKKLHLLDCALSIDFGTLTWDQGLFPFWPVELSPHGLTAQQFTLGIRSLIGPARFLPIQTIQCSTPKRYVRRQPKSCFGENQLLLGSISFSLQPTSHPKILHHQPVRASLHLSTEFTLLMGSSPSFGSYADDNIIEVRGWIVRLRERVGVGD